MNKKILGPTERKQTIQEMRFFLIQNSGGTRQRLKKKKKVSRATSYTLPETSTKEGRKP